MISGLGKASTALRKAMKKAKADKEQKRKEGRETIHDEQAQARGADSAPSVILNLTFS